MTYVPQAPDAFFPPFTPAPSSAFDVLWDNHNEVLGAYQQTVAMCAVPFETTAANPLLWRFRGRGNAGFGKLQVRMQVVQTGSGDFDFVLRNDAGTEVDTDTTTSSGTYEVELAIVPDAADDAYELEVVRTSGVGTVQVQAWVAWTEAPTVPSGVPGVVAAPDPNPWLAADQAIATEHVERLTNGPRALAQDRPHCLFSHFSPEGATALKDDYEFDQWGWVGSVATASDWHQVGRGLIEVTGPRARTVCIDSWVIASATAAASLRVGGSVFELPATGQWERVFLTLDPGIHEIFATVQVNGATESARFHAVQVWRL
jgi:hypothetical protein